MRILRYQIDGQGKALSGSVMGINEINLRDAGGIEVNIQMRLLKLTWTSNLIFFPKSFYLVVLTVLQRSTSELGVENICRISFELKKFSSRSSKE